MLTLDTNIDDNKNAWEVQLIDDLGAIKLTTTPVVSLALVDGDGVVCEQVVYDKVLTTKCTFYVSCASVKSNN